MQWSTLIYFETLRAHLGCGLPVTMFLHSKENNEVAEIVEDN
jgi:hypothetical protein